MKSSEYNSIIDFKTKIINLRKTNQSIRSELDFIVRDFKNISYFKFFMFKIPGYLISFASFFLLITLFSALFFIDFLSVPDDSFSVFLNNFSIIYLIVFHIIYFKKIRKKFKLFKKFKDSQAFIKIKQQEIEDINKEIEKTQLIYDEKLMHFNFQEYLKDKDLVYFHQCSPIENSVIDDYRSLLNNNKGFQNYMMFNKKANKIGVSIKNE